MDAYTDFGPSTPVVKDDSRPVTKKNKNQRKRENAEKMRQLSESENRADTNVEVIDSWEDLEAPVDDETNVPRSIEFPVKEKIETPVPKKEEPVRYFYELRTGQKTPEITFTNFCSEYFPSKVYSQKNSVKLNYFSSLVFWLGRFLHKIRKTNYFQTLYTYIG